MGMYCFGIDVGGTSVKCGLFLTNGTLVEQWEIPTRLENNGSSILPDVADAPPPCGWFCFAGERRKCACILRQRASGKVRILGRGTMACSVRQGTGADAGTVFLTVLGKVCPVWAGVDYCFLMVSVEPMDALMMAVRAAHWARLSCSFRKRKPERAARAGSRLMRILNVREGRFLSAMISTP